MVLVNLEALHDMFFDVTTVSLMCCYNFLDMPVGSVIQTIEAPRFERRRADPKNVAAIILGGGAGTQLFPLTSRTATPAVRS